MSPALSEMVREMGGADLLVARHGYDQWSDEQLPIIGDQTGYDYERLLAINPTHVLIEPGMGGVPERMTRYAEDRGWTLVLLDTLTLDDVQASVSAIGELLDAPDRAASWFQRWDNSITTIDGASGERPLILIGTDPPSVLGPGSVHHEILVRMGMQVLPESGQPHQMLSLEDVIALDPSLLIIMSPQSADAADVSVESALGPLRRIGIDAVRDGRVIVVQDTKAFLPSTSLIGVAEEIANKLKALREGR